ncbi:MAG TPA: T9SS type A sorting domain-containing protein [Candidatus Cloacimonadota bacterium]|jgi:hypothetical protein|nr:T9SS type A sorting domain-containing protein [Candidatus Cloacimonadota bacterium]
MKNPTKKRIINISLLFVLILTQNKIFSQLVEPDTIEYDYYEWVYIKTPKGDSLEATVWYGEPPEWKAYWTEYGDSIVDLHNWTSCTRLDSGTTEYNCHAFAWYVSEGGNDVWINPKTESEGPSGVSTNPNLEKMISDSSYKRVTEIEDYNQFGVKIVYQFPYNDYEHSAISTNDTAYVISKWAKYGLYKHYKHECEYYYSSDDVSPDTTYYAEYRYYILNPKMTEESISILCNNVQRTFSTDITDMPGAEFTWDTGDYITTIDGGGIDDYFIKVKGAGNGDTHVNLELTTNTGFTWSADNDFYAGKPVFTSISGPSPYPVDKGCTGEQYTFWAYPARDPDSQSSYEWMVAPDYYNWYFQYQYYDWVTIVFNDPYDYYQVIARAINTCGPSNWVSTLNDYGYVEMMDCYYFSMYPNPASDYVTFTFNVRDKDKDYEIPSEFRIQIIDNAGITYFSTTKSGDSFTIPVTNLKDGNYIVIITFDKKFESIPLIIKH